MALTVSALSEPVIAMVDTLVSRSLLVGLPVILPSNGLMVSPVCFHQFSQIFQFSIFNPKVIFQYLNIPNARIQPKQISEK